MPFPAIIYCATLIFFDYFKGCYCYPDYIQAETAKKAVVQNVNTNVIAVDPKAVAEELLKILEPYLKNRRSFGQSAGALVRDLESAVSPILQPSSRRFQAPVFLFSNVADDLDRITRQTLLRDPNNDPFTVEILSRNLVSRMMSVLRSNIHKPNLRPRTDCGPNDYAYNYRPGPYRYPSPYNFQDMNYR